MQLRKLNVLKCMLPLFVFCRHGYRIDVQGAQDSVSGLEYSRILSQMRGTDAAEGHLERVRSCTLNLTQCLMVYLK